VTEIDRGDIDRGKYGWTWRLIASVIQLGTGMDTERKTNADRQNRNKSG